MAVKNKRLQLALTRFADTVAVKIDGEEVFVPTTKESNHALNCLLVSQARKILQENLKRIRDADVIVTPREMKDLIDSISKLAESSHTVYISLDGLDIAEKQATPAGEEPAVDLDFEVINHTQTKHERTNGDDNTGATPAGAPAGTGNGQATN